MLKRLDHFDLHFSLGGYDFHISNIVLERFERSIPRHSHSKNSYEIHYIPFGYGKAVINGNTYEIVPNTLFVTGPFIEHSQIPNPQDPMWEYCIYLKIGRSLTPSVSQPEKNLAGFFRQTNFWFGQDSQDIHTLMKQLFSELEHRYTGYSIQAGILLTQLIIKLVRNYEGKMESNSYIGSPNLMLKDHYGKTFLQKKTEARMSAASILLQNPDLSITKIAENTGYSCIEHFSASFKRYYGQSATAYRKQFSSKS